MASDEDWGAELEKQEKELEDKVGLRTVKLWAYASGLPFVG